MQQAYIIGEVMTTPEAVMIDGRRVAPPLHGWARSGSAPCTVCEVETEAIWEGVLTSHEVRHSVWKVIAYGGAANVLDTVRSGLAVGLSGIIWDRQTGEEVSGNEGVFTLHVTEAHLAQGRQERVVLRGATGRSSDSSESESRGTPPDDYEFFYDLSSP